MLDMEEELLLNHLAREDRAREAEERRWWRVRDPEDNLLLPEGDVDDERSFVPWNRIDRDEYEVFTCSHGLKAHEGLKTPALFHLDESTERWELCDDWREEYERVVDKVAGATFPSALDPKEWR